MEGLLLFLYTTTGIMLIVGGLFLLPFAIAAAITALIIPGDKE